MWCLLAKSSTGRVGAGFAMSHECTKGCNQGCLQGFNLVCSTQENEEARNLETPSCGEFGCQEDPQCSALK